MSKASFEVLHQDEWVELTAEFAKCTLMKIGWQNEAVEGQSHPLPDVCGTKLPHRALREAHHRF